MREEEPHRIDHWNPFIVRLTAALQNLPIFHGTVYRGIGSRVDKSLYATDQIVVWHAFSSSATSAAVAELFLGANDSESTLFVLESVTARIVSPLSCFENECEALFSPNSMFRVLGEISHGIKQLLSQAMKRDLTRVTCYSLKEVTVTNFEFGLTAPESEYLEPFVSRLKMVRVRERDEKYTPDPTVQRVADGSTKYLFFDMLCRYPGALRLLAHEYGAGQVLYMALVGLRVYQSQGRVQKTAGDVLIDLLGKITDDCEYVDMIDFFGPVCDYALERRTCRTCGKEDLGQRMWECLNLDPTQRKTPEERHYQCENCIKGKLQLSNTRSYKRQDFMQILVQAAWTVGDLFVVHRILRNGMLTYAEFRAIVGADPTADDDAARPQSDVDRFLARFARWILESFVHIFKDHMAMEDSGTAAQPALDHRGAPKTDGGLAPECVFFGPPQRRSAKWSLQILEEGLQLVQELLEEIPNYERLTHATVALPSAGKLKYIPSKVRSIVFEPLEDANPRRLQYVFRVRELREVLQRIEAVSPPSEGEKGVRVPGQDDKTSSFACEAPDVVTRMRGQDDGIAQADTDCAPRDLFVDVYIEDTPDWVDLAHLLLDIQGPACVRLRLLLDEEVVQGLLSEDGGDFKGLQALSAVLRSLYSRWKRATTKQTTAARGERKTSNRHHGRDLQDEHDWRPQVFECNWPHRNVLITAINRRKLKRCCELTTWKPKQEQKPEAPDWTGAGLSIDMKPYLVGTRKCAFGHNLKEVKNGENSPDHNHMLCNKCHMSADKEEKYWLCGEGCSYALCPSCYERPLEFLDYICEYVKQRGKLADEEAHALRDFITEYVNVAGRIGHSIKICRVDLVVKTPRGAPQCGPRPKLALWTQTTAAAGGGCSARR